MPFIVQKMNEGRWDMWWAKRRKGSCSVRTEIYSRRRYEGRRDKCCDSAVEIEFEIIKSLNLLRLSLTVFMSSIPNEKFD